MSILYGLGNLSVYMLDSFILKNCFFNATNILKNSDKGKYVYSGYGITFDSGGTCSFGIDINSNF